MHVFLYVDTDMDTCPNLCVTVLYACTASLCFGECFGRRVIQHGIPLVIPSRLGHGSYRGPGLFEARGSALLRYQLQHVRVVEERGGAMEHPLQVSREAGTSSQNESIFSHP